MTREKPRCLEVGDQVLILLPTDSNKLSMQYRGAYIVKSHVGVNDYRVKMRSKTKTYHVNVLKKYIAREPEVDVVHTSNQVDATIAAAGVVHQDTDPELGEVPDLEVKLGKDLSEDQQCILKDSIRGHSDIFPDMPGETDMIQHRVKLKDNTKIRCKPCKGRAVE